jgi:hypothetical protein
MSRERINRVLQRKAGTTNLSSATRACGTPTAQARVERRAIELNPEALRVIRVGEVKDHVVHLVPA